MSAVAAAPPRRGWGIGLLILAVGASLLAYASQGLGLLQELPANSTSYAVAFVLLAVAGWFAVRLMARDADPVLYPTAVALSGIGLAVIYRLMVDAGDPSAAALQATWLAIAVVLFALTLFALRDIRRLDAFTYTIGLAGVILLLLPIVPGIGQEINGAKLWVQLGDFVFQPAEFGRILIVIFLASYLAGKRELLAAGVGKWGLPRVKDMGPLLLAWGVSLAILFLERDMGASLLLFGVFVVMLWVATGRWSFLLLGLVLFAAGAFVGYLAFDHVQDRVAFWLHALEPEHVGAQGYGQLAQGWYAMASGGMVGSGLGLGAPDLIPFRASDFILAVIGEELGMLGVSAVLLLYLVLIGRGLRVAIERADGFQKLLAIGLTTLIGLQVFVIAAGILRLIPLTGVPLPLVSYGGTSRIATAISIALLIRISAGPWIRRRRRKRASTERAG